MPLFEASSWAAAECMIAVAEPTEKISEEKASSRKTLKEIAIELIS